MIEPIGDFYCKPQSEEEAREIVERAVAHGAKLDEAPFAGKGVSRNAGWGEYTSWAVFNGFTHTQDEIYYTDQGKEHLTLDQLRERAPFVSELTPNAKSWAAFDSYPSGLCMTENEWQAARRALYFAGMLTNDEKDKLEEYKDAVDSCRMVHEEVARQATANMEEFLERLSKEKNKKTDTEIGDSGYHVERPMNSAPEFLNAALGHMQDRAATYDAPGGERSMGKTVAAFNALYGTELTEEQGWAFMCILKLVRTSQGAFRADNYEDLAAYAGLMGESASKGE